MAIVIVIAIIVTITILGVVRTAGPVSRYGDFWPDFDPNAASLAV